MIQKKSDKENSRTASDNEQEKINGLIGFGEFSARKSYYPELQKIISELKEEKNRYERIFSDALSGIFQADPYGGIIVANPAMVKICGYTSSEHLKSISDIGNQLFATPEEKNKLLDRLLKKSSVMAYETRFKKFDGTIVEVALNASLIKTSAGLSLECFVHDITKHKASERALHESEQKYRSIMDSMEEATYICSSDFIIEYMNPAMIKRTGYNATGETCHKIIHGFDTQCQWYTIGAVINGQSTNYEIVSPRDNRTFNISNSPIFHTDGSVSKLSIFRDITELKRLEANLQQAQKMEAIGTLAGGIAHDFNNILFPIMGYAEMLLDDAPEDSFLQKGLNKIYTGALRAKELVKQILTFSRQETSELQLIKIKPVITEALKLIRSSIPTSIDINRELIEDCGVIKADPTQIHQIVMNLATNAFHAMEGTTGELKISLKEVVLSKEEIDNPDMQSGVYACLSVSDTGVGIPPELAEKIFDPFFTTKEKGKGTGMGLSVVHGIINSMGGQIKVHSEPGIGTEFQIFLPVVMDSSEKPAITAKNSLQRGNERIMLVDDEKSIITMEQQLLERLGYQVRAYTDSRDALNYFSKNPDKVDIVITDLAMPNIPGDILAMEMIKIRPEIPVLLCTGFSETLSEETITGMGVKGFLAKPIEMKDLAQKIRCLLDKKPAPVHVP